MDLQQRGVVHPLHGYFSSFLSCGKPLLLSLLSGILCRWLEEEEGGLEDVYAFREKVGM